MTFNTTSRFQTPVKNSDVTTFAQAQRQRRTVGAR